MEIPKLNETYNCYDDGKIRESRLYTVTITEIINFEDVDVETLLVWKHDVKTFPHLYKRTTDYLIKTKTSNGDTEIFARTIDDGWFGLEGWWCGRLDVDLSLTNSIKNKQ